MFYCCNAKLRDDHYAAFPNFSGMTDLPLLPAGNGEWLLVAYQVKKLQRLDWIREVKSL